MRAMTWLSAMLVFAVACKKGDEKAEMPSKTVEAQKQEVTPPPADVPVTAKTAEAVKVFQIARHLRNAGRQADAVQQFKKAIELDPEFAQAHAYLATLLPNAEATEAHAKAVSLSGKLPEAEQQLIVALQANHTGDVATAKTAYEKALELAPGSMRVAWARGALALSERDYPGAIKFFQIVVRLDPKNVTAYNALAYAYGGQREWDQAFTNAKKQIEMVPKEANPHDTFGEVLIWAGKHDEAEKEFAAAVAMEPKFVGSWQGVGLARAYRGDFKGAHEAFDKRRAAPEMMTSSRRCSTTLGSGLPRTSWRRRSRRSTRSRRSRARRTVRCSRSPRSIALIS